MQYKDAEIYLTSCTHPDYSFIRYLGLDTKKDKNYLGSSVVLKWFISLIGRSYFKKQILETVSGSMRDCCELEQKYILQHDAVRDPNYLNMNGGKQRLSSGESVISLDFSVNPTTDASKGFIREVLLEVRNNIHFYTFARGQLSSQIISALLYSFFKYGQEGFEYSKYSNYGGCTPEAVEEVVTCLTGIGYIEHTGTTILITSKLIESIPDILGCEDFNSILRGY